MPYFACQRATMASTVVSTTVVSTARSSRVRRLKLRTATSSPSCVRGAEPSSGGSEDHYPQRGTHDKRGDAQADEARAPAIPRCAGRYRR